MIRLGTVDDLSEVIDLGSSLFHQTVWSGHIEFDQASFRESLIALIGSDGLLVAVHNGSIAGVLGFIVAPIYANGAHSYAQEVFVIAKPDCPGAGRMLIAAFEQEARSRGAIATLVAAQVGLRDRALGRLFQRLGYAETERTFMKGL